MVHVNTNGKFLSEAAGSNDTTVRVNTHSLMHLFHQQHQKGPASHSAFTTFNPNIHVHSNSTPTSSLWGQVSAHASRAASTVGSRVASPSGSTVGVRGLV